MSYYYNYYIGYRKDGKFYPWGPYNANGELLPAVWKSRSFASDLHKSFCEITDDEVSDELRKEFEYEDWNGNKKVVVKYLAVKDLPKGDIINSGYFLIDDVRLYEKDHDRFDLFYDKLSPQIYAAKLENQIKFGPNQPQKDNEHKASDYMFYAFPDYESAEYEAFMLRYYAETLRDCTMPDDVEWCILETEG